MELPQPNPAVAPATAAVPEATDPSTSHPSTQEHKSNVPEHIQFTREEIEDFLASLDDYTPTIPDEVTQYFLDRTGFICPEMRVKRLIALAAQKFLSDVANDALQHCKLRQARSKREKKYVLTMEDLAQSLKEYGIKIKKPDYFADRPASSASK